MSSIDIWDGRELQPALFPWKLPGMPAMTGFWERADPDRENPEPNGCLGTTEFFIDGGGVIRKIWRGTIALRRMDD